MTTKVVPWPELSSDELARFYGQIKQNKVIDINWTNPGQLDPELVLAKLRSKNQTEPTADESEKMAEDLENEAEFVDANDASADMNNEFDLFDEFNSDEKSTKDKISELRLKHSTTRDTKKVASMDKILFDIKKKIETEEYIRKYSTDDASSILSEATPGEIEKKPDSIEPMVAESESPFPSAVAAAANPALDSSKASPQASESKPDITEPTTTTTASTEAQPAEVQSEQSAPVDAEVVNTFQETQEVKEAPVVAEPEPTPAPTPAPVEPIPPVLEQPPVESAPVEPSPIEPAPAEQAQMQQEAAAEAAPIEQASQPVEAVLDSNPGQPTAEEVKPEGTDMNV